MPTTITSGASTITPTQVLGYSSSRPVMNIIHPVLGAASPDVTLRLAGLRKGTLELGFQGTTSEATSLAAENLLKSAVTFTLTSTDRTSIQMNFVLDGTLERELEGESRNAWIVTFGWQEVA